MGNFRILYVSLIFIYCGVLVNSSLLDWKVEPASLKRIGLALRRPASVIPWSFGMPVQFRIE
jgi:hypothetical protein